jgi:hypothetical protein
MVPFCWAVLLAFLVVIAYLPALKGGFIWDDDAHISDNTMLRSLRGLWAIWFEPGATYQYYPLSFSVFWLEYHLWGLDTFGYHLVNVFLHLAAVLLFWRVLKQLRVPGAWLAAGLFALHPVMVMSVAWMTELKNTLSTCLALGSMLAYLRFADVGKDETMPTTGRWRFYALAPVLFQLALFAKTAVSFVPVTLLLVLWWRKPPLRWTASGLCCQCWQWFAHWVELLLK